MFGFSKLREEERDRFYKAGFEYGQAVGFNVGIAISEAKNFIDKVGVDAVLQRIEEWGQTGC